MGLQKSQAVCFSTGKVLAIGGCLTRTGSGSAEEHQGALACFQVEGDFNREGGRYGTEPIRRLPRANPVFNQSINQLIKYLSEDS